LILREIARKILRVQRPSTSIACFDLWQALLPGACEAIKYPSSTDGQASADRYKSSTAGLCQFDPAYQITVPKELGEAR